MKTISILTLTLTLTLAGCGADPQTLTDADLLSWNADEIEVVVVSQERGDLSFEAGFGDEVEAKVTRACHGDDEAEAQRRLDAVQVLDQVLGGRLSVVSAPGDGCTVDLTFVLPPKLHVDAWTNDGSIVVVGEGDLTVVSHRGAGDEAHESGTFARDIVPVLHGMVSWPRCLPARSLCLRARYESSTTRQTPGPTCGSSG